MIALDTDLLVYAHRRATPEHKAARRAIERARQSGLGWGMTDASLVEFYAVVTHPSARPPPARGAGRSVSRTRLQGSRAAYIRLALAAPASD
jgi:hypothetical protein